MDLVYLKTTQRPRVDILDNHNNVICKAGELHVEESVITGPFEKDELEKWVRHAVTEYGTMFQEWEILDEVPNDKTLVVVQNAVKYHVEITD